MVNAGSSKIVGKTKDVDASRNGQHFGEITCPLSQIRISPKLIASQIQILGCHTLPIPCNNQPNQFLVVINDWVNETRKVVDSLMGSPFDIWLFPIGPEG